MAKVGEGLTKRRGELEGSEGWFEPWFNSTPWLTTLVSILLGLLLVLVLLLTFGPCILNWLLWFIKEMLGTI